MGNYVVQCSDGQTNLARLIQWTNVYGLCRMEHDANDCEACLQHEKMCQELARMPMDRDWDKLWCTAMRIWKRDCPAQKTSVRREGNGKPNGVFAGTLTMSDKDETDEATMCSAISKVFSQQTVPVEKYAWYLEYTEKGLPHIHFIYKTHTGGRIYAKIFKRYWKTWDESVKCGKGHRGGYHKVVESETAYLEYIKKDDGKCAYNWE